MDSTAISILGFSLLTLIIWCGVVLLGVYIVLRIRARTPSGGGNSLLPVIFQHKLWIVSWLICLVAAAVFTGRETAYRPKTRLAPANPERQALEQRIDNAPQPEIKRSKPDQDMQAAMEKNRAENRKTIEDFKKLPGK